MSDKRYQELADRLNGLIERPQFAGKRWTWDLIGQVLGISAPEAQRLVQWMRRNTTDMVWTVGTYTTDYQIVPTKSTRDALDGIINQFKHLRTRLLTMRNVAQILADNDPDPILAKAMARTARLHERQAGEVEDHVEALRDLLEPLKKVS